MPQLKPPHYQGVKYDGVEAKPGAFVDVRDGDVASLRNEGWLTADDIARDYVNGVVPEDEPTPLKSEAALLDDEETNS